MAQKNTGRLRASARAVRSTPFIHLRKPNQGLA
jgi:hypothetical protein